MRVRRGSALSSARPTSRPGRIAPATQTAGCSPARLATRRLRGFGATVASMRQRASRRASPNVRLGRAARVVPRRFAPASVAKRRPASDGANCRCAPNAAAVGPRGCPSRAKASQHPPSFRRVSRAVPVMLLSVRHIGPRRAQRLVDGLGVRWVELIDADPERVFGTLRGMGRRRARIAAASWRELTSSAAADRDRGIAAPVAPYA